MPRAGLSSDVVVAEAARLIDERGSSALTLSAVAQRLGVAQPSLYKHVAGLEDLHGRLAVVTTRDLAASMRVSISGRAGAEALVAVSTAYREYARQHPGHYGYLLRPRQGDPEHERASGELLDVLGAVLAGYGVEGVDAVDAVRLLRSALHGFVSLNGGGGFAMERDVEASFATLVAALDRALATWPRSAAD